MKYAIIDKETNIVLNVILSDDESDIFLNESEFAVPATRSTKIGILYDPISKTFPAVLELDELLDFREEVESLEAEISPPLPNHLIGENRKLFSDYLGKLSEIKIKSPSEGRKELKSLVKPDLSLLIPPPEKEVPSDPSEN